MSFTEVMEMVTESSRKRIWSYMVTNPEKMVIDLKEIIMSDDFLQIMAKEVYDDKIRKIFAPMAIFQLYLEIDKIDHVLCSCSGVGALSDACYELYAEKN